MQTLIKQTTVPPDGFRYLQPETETWIRAGDYFDLFEKVKAHRKANNVPIGPLWKEEIEDQLCRQLPAGFCKESDPQARQVNVPTRMEWRAIEAFTKTMVAWAAERGKTASEALANARAGICRSCYLNVPVPGCKSCHGMLNLVIQLAKGKRLLNNRNLRNCAVCKCHLPAKVWLPIDVIKRGTTPETLSQYPAFCWIPKELAQDGMGTSQP
jgi:hypothetical protein